MFKIDQTKKDKVSFINSNSDSFGLTMEHKSLNFPGLRLMAYFHDIVKNDNERIRNGEIVENLIN